MRPSHLAPGGLAQLPNPPVLLMLPAARRPSRTEWVWGLWEPTVNPGWAWDLFLVVLGLGFSLVNGF